MDSMNLMITIIIMMIAIQFNMAWISAGTLLIIVLTERNLHTTIILGLSLVVIYLTQYQMKEFWPIVMIGLIVFALLFGQGGGKKSEYYSPDLSGLMGGGGM